MTVDTQNDLSQPNLVRRYIGVTATYAMLAGITVGAIGGIAISVPAAATFKEEALNALHHGNAIGALRYGMAMSLTVIGDTMVGLAGGGVFGAAAGIAVGAVAGRMAPVVGAGTKPQP